LLENLIGMESEAEQAEKLPSLTSQERDNVSLFKSLLYTARKSKLFLIQKEQAEVFYDMPHMEQLYKCTFRLPFPMMFVEFSNPLKVREINRDSNDNETSKEDELRGVLMMRDYDALKSRDIYEAEKKGMKIANYPSLEEILKSDLDEEKKLLFRSYNMLFFDSKFRYAKLVFDPLMLPVFSFYKCAHWKDCDRANRYDYNNAKSVACWTKQGENCERAKEFIKHLDLSMNLINYINSKNIEFEKISNSERLNKKRIENGKPPLRDFYRIKIDKRQAVYSGTGGIGSKHSFRYDVRGHFAFYQHCPTCNRVYSKAIKGDVACKRCGNEIKEDKWKVKTRWVADHIRGLSNSVYIPKSVREVKENNEVKIE